MTLNGKEYDRLQTWAQANKITFIDRSSSVGYFNWAIGALCGSTDKTFATAQAEREGWKVLGNLAALVEAWKAWKA